MQVLANMDLAAVDITWTVESLDDEPFNIQIEEVNSSDSDFVENSKSSVGQDHSVPGPPPPPNKTCLQMNRDPENSCSVPKETKDMWDKLFKQGYGADVHVISEDGSIVRAHRSVLVSNKFHP